MIRTLLAGFAFAIALTAQAQSDLASYAGADRMERLAAAVRPDSRLLFLCNPQNPGGTIFTRAELERLAARLGWTDQGGAVARGLRDVAKLQRELKCRQGHAHSSSLRRRAALPWAS